MNNVLNLFKNRLNILFCLVFILSFIPVLTANEPETGKSVGWVERGETQQLNPQSETCGEQSRTIQNSQLDKVSFAQKTMKLHMPFIANNGQMDRQVKFYAKTFGGTVFVTKEGEIVYALPMNSSECRGEWHSPNGIHDEVGMLHDHYISDIVHPASWIVDRDSKSEFHNPKLISSDSKNLKSGVALREEFVGSRVKAIQGEEPSVTKVSYFKGNDPSKWKTNISTYDAVNLGEIYDGIELKLRAYGNNVEKLFCLKPGVGTEIIRLRLSGGKDFNINNKGELEVETELGLVKFTKPVAYQEISGKRVEVECKYTIADCGMQNAECKTNLKSKIENAAVCHPECNEGSLALKRDSSPSAQNDRKEPAIRNSNYEIKNLQSENPKSAIRNPKFVYGFKVASYDSTKDLIIDPLLASTFLGGSGSDYGRSLTLDTSGHVYVTGETGSTDFPTTSGAYDTSFNGGNGDVFISKLDSGLTTLLASTYLGGSGTDVGNSITLDTSGGLYVTGHTGSTDFPTTSGSYDTSFNGSEYYYDVFISKLDSGLTNLLASTYLGGYNEDRGNSLTFDTSGDVYVTGDTGSTDFPTTSGAYDTSQNSDYYDGDDYNDNDVFISKLDSGLTSLLASTFLGGSSSDYGSFLALDTSGDVYVIGDTSSLDFPTTSGAYDTFGSGVFVSKLDSRLTSHIISDLSIIYWQGVFVSKLDSRLTSLLASTFLGGSDWDSGDSLTLDTSGNVYVTGWTLSTDFPTTRGAFDTSQNGNRDVFVSKLNGGLTNLLASTYIGGSSEDRCFFLTLDTSGDVYVVGDTYSSDFPTTLGAYDTSFNGGFYSYHEDVFVSKLDSRLTSLLASTFLGGSDWDYGNSLTLDTSGHVYVTGWTYSEDFPTTNGAYDTQNNPYSSDAFVLKLDGNLSADDSTCEADNMDVDPGNLEIQTGSSADETITITCADAVTPVSGETVKAKVKSGKDKVTVSPRSAVTDENGLAVFTIQGVKEGRAWVEFKDAAAGLKVIVKIKVTQ